MSAVVRHISTASGFIPAETRHPMLDKKAMVLPQLGYWPCCLFDWEWWQNFSDPHLWKQGLAIRVGRDEERGGFLFTILFGDSDTGVQQAYPGRRLKFLPDD